MTTLVSDKDRPHAKRSTFLPGREVLERSRSMLEQTGGALREVQTTDPREELFCDSLDALLRDLSGALGDFCEAAPAKVLEQQTQYTVEMAHELESPVIPTSIEMGLSGSLALTRSLRDRFQKVADAAGAEDLRDAYESLTRLVLGYEKRIARLAEGGHDL